MTLYFAAFTMVITAVTHAVLGERRLIGPLLTIDTGVLAVPLARQVLRFAWHLTSVLMVACAVTIVVPGVPDPVTVVIGLAWLLAGLVDVIYTRGRHVGWPLLVASGALPLWHALA